MAAVVIKKVQEHRRDSFQDDHRDRDRRDRDRRDRDRRDRDRRDRDHRDRERDRDRGQRDREQDQNRGGGEAEEKQDLLNPPDGGQAEDPIVQLPAMQKLLNGENMDLVLEEVKELCDKLEPDKEGKVKLEVLRQLLLNKLTPQPTEKEITDLLTPAMNHSGADEETKFEDCDVSPADFLWALTHGKSARNFRSSYYPREEKPEIDVDFLTASVVKITDRHDAFMTLPITVVYMLVFVALVVSHLRIWDRQYTEKTLEQWINGRDPRTDCENNVDGMEAFWEWLLGDEDGIQGAMAIERSSATDPAMLQYVLANRNILIGDLILEYEKFDGETKREWLISSDVGQAALNSSTKDYKAAAVEAASDLQQNGWSDPEIHYMTVGLTTYNEKSRMFSRTQIRITFFETGAIHARINSEVVSVEPYPTGFEYVWEAIFAFMVFWMMWTEGKDIFHALKLGCGEFKDYWQFWNCVDWVTIALGVMLILMWVACIVAMNDASLSELLDQDWMIKADVMALDRSQCAKVMESVESIQLRFRWLHIIIAANTVSIVSKFFKAFTSNPRLKVVTDTFSHAGTDFAHFIIIFFTLYLPFTIIGHVLFGNDIDEFSSITSSFNTGMTVLMGDFGWYIDASASSALKGETASLPSGMPILVLSLWFVLYMFLVFLVLLNVLLAIIIKHHTEVDAKLDIEPDAPPIWVQVTDYIKFKRQTRQYVKLEHMRRMLENDDDRAHEKEGDEVTKESLMSAFPGMTEEQADYEMSVLREELKKAREVEADKNGSTDARKEQMNLLVDNGSKLDEISDAVLNAKPVDKGVASCRRKLEDLLNIVDRMQRDQKQLVKRIDEMSSRMGPSAYSKDSQSASDMKEEKMRRDDRKADGKEDRRGRKDEDDRDDRRKETRSNR